MLRLLFALSILASLDTSDAPAAPPNIVLVITDDQGYGDLGFHGHPLAHTPNLDAFARQATSFNQFLCSPVCSPTRASLMTGRYNYRTDVHDTWIGRSTMNPNEVTVAEALGAHGYATGIFGKWHLGDCHPMRPQDQGFDDVLVHLGGGISQKSDPIDGSSYQDPTLQHNGVEKKFDGYVMDVYTDHAIEFIEKNQDQPFFCYLATNTPHAPWDDAPAEDLAHYDGAGLSEKQAIYYGMISNIDRNFARLLAKIDELGVRENTIVIFMSDNGQASAGKEVYDAGLRGRKSQVFENGVRVPFFIDLPNDKEAGRVVETQAAHIDLLPTLLDLAGAAHPDPAVKLDGVSLRPLLEGPDPVGPNGAWPDRPIMFQTHRGKPVRYRNACVRTMKWKLILSNFPGDGPPTQRPDLKLFDLVNDPGEERNLVHEHPAIVAEMKAQYEAWFDDVTAGNDYVPHRIYVGTDAEPRTNLTRMEWVGAPSWQDKSVGNWLVEVKEEGPYDLRVQFPEPTEEDVQLFAGPTDALQEATLAAGQFEHVFKNVPLAAGECDLTAYKLVGEEDFGALRLIVSRSSAAE